MNLSEPQEKKRRVAIYLRVSTVEQNVEGHSLDAQLKRLREHCENNPALNLEFSKDRIYKDVHTGGDINRRALARLRQDAKDGKFDTVLVWKIDRFSRSLKHLLTLFEELKESNVGFISKQENIDFKGAIGTLIFQIFGAIAEFERSLIQGRTAMGKIASAEAGNYTGTNIPYGYEEIPNVGRKGKTLAHKEDEVEWVKNIYDWYIYDRMGFGMIAKKLNELGVPKNNHKRNKRTKVEWTPLHVSTIIKQSLYKGVYIANKKGLDGSMLPADKWTLVHFKPIVSEFVWAQAQHILNDKGGGDQTRDYLLSGKLYDMTLDKPRKFVGKKRNDAKYSYCRKQFKDSGTGEKVSVFEIPAKQIEDYVWGKIVDALEDPAVFIEKYIASDYQNPTKAAKIEQELEILKKKEGDIYLQIEKIEHAYETGRYSEEKMSTKLEQANTELATTEGSIKELEDERDLMASVAIEVQELEKASDQFKHNLANLGRREQKMLCNLFVERINLSKTERPTEKKRKEWDISVDIMFRFNLSKLQQEYIEGRTSKAQDVNEKASLDVPDVNDGGRCKT